MIRWSPVARRQASCPHRRLARLLAAALPEEQLRADSTLHPWASANFIGARHLFRCTLRGNTPPEALRRRLNDMEWRLPGHFVADVAVEPGDTPAEVQIEILTVED